MYRNKTFEDGVFNDQCELTDSIANHSSSCPFGYEYQGGKNVSFVSEGHYDVKIVLMMEIFPARMRGNVIILDGLLWGVGITVLAGLGYAFDGLNWRHVQLMMLPPFVVIIAYFFLIDESIRWLIANGKYKKAQKIQEKIAKMNRYKPKPVVAGEDSVFMFDQQLPVLPEGEIPTEKHSQAQDTDVVVKYNVFGILKHKKSRFLLIGMCFVWFTNSLIYLGLFMMTTAMSGDRLLNVLLSAAVEIPAMGGTYVCSRWAAGLGISSGCARIGSIMAPFSSYVFRKAAWAPGAVFGSLSLLVSIYLLFVPETRHRELPQTLADIDLWFTKTGPEADVLATDQKCVEPISENRSDTNAVRHASDKRKS
ncbi:organic anion transporter 3-like [Liolophura sinensis]|uniref:organic anion transporter 3-like n=1 Tax=Liolophura sinensis TaxID=3198878 RepID=UPI003158D81B